MSSKTQSSRVVALIINWNGADDTIELLGSLRGAAAAGVDLQAVIVDNASEATDFAKLKAFVHDTGCGLPTKLIRNAANVGIPAAYNQAIAAVGLDYDAYLRLDNDVVLPDGAIDLLLRGLSGGQAAGFRIVGGNVRYFDRPDVDNGGAVTIDLVRGRTSVAYPRHATACDGVLGCVMLVDGELVRTFAPDVFLGPLFLATDESELSLRARRRGWRTLYVPTVVGYHKGGRSTKKVAVLSEYYSARNWAFLRLRYTDGFAVRAAVLLSILTHSVVRILQLRPTYARGSLAGVAWYSREFRARGRRAPAEQRHVGTGAR